MFRLFLVNLIQSGKDIEENSKPSLPPKRIRNRRVYERYNIDHKHLALMNDQDILIIRNLSENGFATEVSERAFKRFHTGDVYLCRMRYLGEIFDCHAQVIWKAKKFVGFELKNIDEKLMYFMERLINPLRIGTSLQRVDEKIVRSIDNEGLVWFQGEQEANLFIWPADVDGLRCWQFEQGGNYIKWEAGSGLTTGKSEQLFDISNPWTKKKIEDKDLNEHFKTLTSDVLMAFNDDYKEKLIESLIG